VTSQSERAICLPRVTLSVGPSIEKLSQNSIRLRLFALLNGQDDR
jgi:hypothetical protein